jgi:hypothetical protein
VTPRDELLADVAELGREFTRLGWIRRLQPLREYYAAVAAGQERTERWSPDLVAGLRRVIGLGKAPLPTATRCPRCEVPSDGSWAGARTTLHLEDRWAMECAKCGAEWVCSSEGVTSRR